MYHCKIILMKKTTIEFQHYHQLRSTHLYNLLHMNIFGIKKADYECFLLHYKIIIMFFRTLNGNKHYIGGFNDTESHQGLVACRTW